MRTVQVQDPDGAPWQVRVVWEPRWRALARRYGGWRRKKARSEDGGGGELLDLVGNSGGGGHHSSGDGFDLGDDIFIAVLAIVGLIVFGLLFWWLLLPLLLLLLDAVVVAALLVVSVLGRLLFRRPWRVEATRAPGTTGATAWVVGWRAALRTRDEMADKLRMGYPPMDVAAAHALVADRRSPE